MFCQSCGSQLPKVGNVNFCAKCGNKIEGKVVNRLIERKGIFYELGQAQPFSGTLISRFLQGQIQSESHYVDGLTEGLCTNWRESGSKDNEGLYKQGKKEGLWTWWNAKGQQIIEKYYKNGLKHGLWNDWHANGQKKVEGNFVHGKREGLVTIWDNTGKKMSETLYKNDERV